MRSILAAAAAMAVSGFDKAMEGIYINQPGQERAKRSPAEHERRIAAAEAKRERKAAIRAARAIA